MAEPLLFIEIRSVRAQKVPTCNLNREDFTHSSLMSEDLREMIEVVGHPLHCLARIVGWVERDVGTIYVGFAYLSAP